MPAHRHMRGDAYADMRNFSDERLQMIASRGRALADPTRVRILAVPGLKRNCHDVVALAAGTRQSTASKHLQVLHHAGLVRRRRDASTVFYSLSSDEVLRVCDFLGSRQLV